MAFREYSGPRLPSTLLDQIGVPQRRSRDPRYSKNSRDVRKDTRPQQIHRRDQTQSSANRRSKNGVPAQQLRGRTHHEAGGIDQGNAHNQPKRRKGVPTRQDRQAESEPALNASKLSKTSTQREQPSQDSPVPRRTKERLEEDDAEIAALEKKLGIKSSKLPKSFEEDGLQDLLGDVEVAAGGKRRSKADDEWLATKRMRLGLESDGGDDSDDDEDGLSVLADGIASDFETDDSDEDSAEDESSSPAVEDHDGSGESADSFEDFGSEEDGEQEEGVASMDNGNFRGGTGDTSTSTQRVQSSKIRENPYVAPSIPTASSEKWLPRALRGSKGDDDGDATRLLRRIAQGLLNRLSEANMLSIMGEVERLYRENARQHVTSTLIDLLLDLLSDSTTLNDTFIILHGGFVAAIYRVVGADFGAQFVEGLVERFDASCNLASFSPSFEDSTNTDKRPLNLVSLLAQLYNFQVVSSALVFDYIRLLLSHVSELRTELLLRVVRLSGPQLRSDDPTSLKDMVVVLQKTIAGAGQAQLSVRTKFMLETINDLKNNKAKAGAGASALVTEHTVRMRKTLGSLNQRGSVKTSEPLRIGLRDVKDGHKVGKWWLVGASWKGQRDDGEVGTAPVTSNGHLRDVDVSDGGGGGDEELHSSAVDVAALARRAGMNTSVRRAVFATLLDAADCADAHARLLKLGLTRAQEAEVPRVLLHCVGAEARAGRYNPYYTLVARKLCEGDRRMRMGFQFGAWDLFRRFGEPRDDADGDDDGDNDYNDDDGDDDDAEEEGGDDGFGGGGGAGAGRRSNKVAMTAVVNYARTYADLVVAGAQQVAPLLKPLDWPRVKERTRAFAHVLVVSIIEGVARREGRARRKRKATGDDQGGGKGGGEEGKGGGEDLVRAIFGGVRAERQPARLAAGLQRVVAEVAVAEGERSEGGVYDDDGDDDKNSRGQRERISKGCERILAVLMEGG